MQNRILEICEENRYVSLNRGFVVIQHGTEILGQVPLDDVSVLLLSAQGITLSKNILNALAERGCVTVLCGKNFIPQSMVLPREPLSFYKNHKKSDKCFRAAKEKSLAASCNPKNRKSGESFKIIRKRLFSC